ncbi:hypothetical protein CPB84DRAFT_186789 [Gymnopilus junonius]|uniref:Uncharacterized protein n=1 Tax=Gymnopilus junonius TaxID=109634 RepID=A0A9P5NGB0_GYMJU|nr:hypothetical protein CPB84DRAFT_186789 [Gymnopilus junonius]
MSVVYISALLRLGKKYEIDFFVDQALKCLRFDHPTTLTKWQCIAMPNQYKKIARTECSEGEDNDDMEDIIALSNKHDIPSILHAAYLRLILTYSLETIVSESHTPGLSREDRDKCIVGWDKLSAELRKRRTLWLQGKDLLPAEGCLTSNACRMRQWKAMDNFNLWKDFDDNAENFSALPKQELAVFCSKCAKVVRGRHDEIREEMWQNLPTYFQLEKWEDLKDFDK